MWEGILSYLQEREGLPYVGGELFPPGKRGTADSGGVGTPIGTPANSSPLPDGIAPTPSSK